MPVVSALMYFGLLRIPTRHLFAVTTWLIALLAAGMASQAIVFLQQAGLVTVLSHVVWNTSGVLSDGSLAGKALHTLVGYADRPTGIQLVVYVATLAIDLHPDAIVWPRAPATKGNAYSKRYSACLIFDRGKSPPNRTDRAN